MSHDTLMAELRATYEELQQVRQKMNDLNRRLGGETVEDYTLKDRDNLPVRLSSLFGDKDDLIIVHNMGKKCVYCTLWADGFNGVLAHLESAMAVVLVSKDSPAVQRTLANARGWRFQMASHGGGDYMQEQSISDHGGNEPGAVIYRRNQDDVLRVNRCMFGPNDLYSPIWQFLGMAGLGVADWTPQYRYWTPPSELDDGGENRSD